MSLLSTIRISSVLFKENRLLHIANAILLSISIMLISFAILFNAQLDSQIANQVKGYNAIISSEESEINATIKFGLLLEDSTSKKINYETALKNIPQNGIRHMLPMSYMGEYQGHKIIATVTNYFAAQRLTSMSDGIIWQSDNQVVIGSDVAKEKGLKPGDVFIVNYKNSISSYENEFLVAGILPKSDLPLDNAIFTSLETSWNLQDKLRDSEANLEKTIDAFLIVFFRGENFNELKERVEKQTSYNVANPYASIFKMLHIKKQILLIFWIIISCICFITLLQIFKSSGDIVEKRKTYISVLRVHGASFAKIIQIILCESLLFTFLAYLIGFTLAHICFFLLSSKFIFISSFNFSAFYFSGKEVSLLLTTAIAVMVLNLKSALKLAKTDKYKALTK